MATIAQELQDVCKMQPQPGQTAADFMRKLAVKANGLTDDAWEGLSDNAQRWVQNALDAVDGKRPLPRLKGIVTVKSNGGTPPTKVSKPKAAKPKAEPKPKAARGPATSRFRPKGADKIVVESNNPYRPGSKSHTVFSLYHTGMTVEEAEKAGVPRDYLTWDHRHGFIRIDRAE
jgi:hypothetical protein